MIILNQDKTEIVNFDNVDSVWICPDEEGRFTIEATADTNATLGSYKTEERAKEVLQEIITAYENFNYLKFFPANITKSVEQFMHRKYKHFDVYEMPEE